MSLPAELAGPLRAGDPPVYGRVVTGRCLLDLRSVPVPGPPLIGDWHLDSGHADALRLALAQLRQVDPELPAGKVARRLGLPDPKLLPAVAASAVAASALAASGVAASGVAAPGRGRPVPLPAGPARFDPMPPGQLGLGRAELAAAVSSATLVRIGRGYLPAAAIDEAVAVLRSLPQPFTASQARQALGVSRAVALPLLQHLDRAGVTRCLPDRTRLLAAGSGQQLPTDR